MKYCTICTILTFALFSACDKPEEMPKKKSSNLTISDEVTIDEIQAAFKKGEYTITELTQFYLDRIAAISKNGPLLEIMFG